MKEDTKGVSQTFSGLRAASNISQPFLFFWHNQKYMFMSQVLIQTINKNIKKLKFLFWVLDGRTTRKKGFQPLYAEKKIGIR